MKNESYFLARVFIVATSIAYLAHRRGSDGSEAFVIFCLAAVVFGRLDKVVGSLMTIARAAQKGTGTK